MAVRKKKQSWAEVKKARSRSIDSYPVHPITKLCESENLTLEDVAYKLKVSTITVWRWVNYQRRPEARYLRELIDMTGSNLEELLWIDLDPMPA